MKKILYFFLLAVLSIMPIVISACSDDDDESEEQNSACTDDESEKQNSTFYIDGNLKYVITSDEEVAVSGFSDSNDGVVDGRSSTSLVIPSQVTINGKTYNVTSIAEKAFEFCPCLVSVTIPSSVTKIGVKAFADCRSLTDVSIPSSVALIDSIAFMGCTKADVVVDANADPYPSIASTAFSDVHSLTLSENTISSFENGKIGDYAYVDLGLPSGIKWATYNLGSTYILGHGELYNSNDRYKYFYNRETLEGVTVDTVSAKWGSSWRMPKSTELQELIDGCDWQWVDGFFGQSGQLGTSKVNGKKIFLPAVGEIEYNKTMNFTQGSCWAKDTGSYWWTESTPSQGHTISSGYYLEFSSSDISVQVFYYDISRSIRPVSD